MKQDLLSGVWAAPTRQPTFSPREWELILGQARQARLQGRLAQHFAERDWLKDVPSGPRCHLESGLVIARRQWHEVRWEADCIRRALAKVDTPVVMLKGAAYLLAGLPAARGRIFSDIDILVEPSKLTDVESALFAAGWISEERDAYNDRYYRQWMHELPPLRHVQRGTSIDVHHTITPPTSRFKVDGAKLLTRIQAIPGHPGLYTLSPVDMVLHSAAHLFLEGEFGHGLRDLLDMNDLMIHFSESADFWDELLDRSVQLGLQIPLSHALIHLKRLFSTSPPVPLEARATSLDRSVLTRRLMSNLLELALRPDHPSCDGRFTGLARWMLYVRAHHLRMPMHLVVPHLTRKALMRMWSEDTE
ncbi:MAG: nucleotidyltransferase family protein [Rhizobacter sp.]